ncbi:uncharacterized protein MKK02DRAFT_44236 [Dioszegia hungarica]|uniref:Uncharacterized protein n=1 Tax=Dioszegia hungarica TaxID=4972 RepID=A0AA38HAG7_9TREE|nr:uncharacterized protein MKK02DRAFT_44236 [Dioszegia hungarica]KAI9635546.1 hypothetical protein MKK02DRAFT_44236 [Dioszegia hungarica]
MSLIHRVGMVITIAIAIKSGRIPTARAMTIPDLHMRQDASVAVSAAAAATTPAGSAAVASVSVEPAVASSAVVSSVAAAPAASSAVPSIAAASSAVTPTATSSLSGSVAASSASGMSSGSAALSVSGSTTISTASLRPLATTLAEELESPLPKPNYAPGGMSFILPAFAIIALIFIIWLVVKTKEYIWKLKEAEEKADTQSPDPGALSGHVLPKTGAAPARATTGLGGKWKKKGWKELESESEDEKPYSRHEGRERDPYSRVGEWQGSRKYRSRERGGSRDARHGEGHRDERGRYGRLDVRDEDYDHDHGRPREHHHRERRPSRRDREREVERYREPATRSPHPERARPTYEADPSPPHRKPSASAPTAPLAPAPPPPALPLDRGVSKKDKKDRAEEWIKSGKEYNDTRHHMSERRELGRDHGTGDAKGKGKVPDAYEDEYAARYAEQHNFSLAPPAAGEGGRLPPLTHLAVQMGPAAYKAAGAAPVEAARPAPEANAPPAREPRSQASADKHQASTASSTAKLIRRERSSRKPAPASAPISANPSAESSSSAHEDVPAYMRARAISPPPILSAPHHPTLFFHNGPSTTQLVPLATYDSGTDLESMYSARPSPMPDTEPSRMPDVPSTADKLEQTPAGPPRTVRNPQTSDSSRLVARTPTRTKSHDPSVPPDSPSAGGSRTAALRTPVRRGTDGGKTTGRATPTIRLIESRGSSIKRGGETPDLSKTSGLTPKKHSKRLAPAPTPSSTPESTRRVRAQRKELKARGKVDEILRDSWSERAVVNPAGPVEDDDDEEEVEVEVEEREVEVEERAKPAVKAVPVPRDEVELAHARSRATSPTPTPVKPMSARPISPPPATTASPSAARPLSPRKTHVSTIPNVDSEDINKLQGIEQRMALMKQLEERVKR